ncbi:MAG: hypothetical protein AAFQ95_24000 [Cyanobacteria bacterium J06621_3]
MQSPIQVKTGSGALVPGLICTMSQEHLLQIETIWQGMLLALQEPDKAWNWGYKLRLATNEDRFEAYVVEIDGLAQGVILIETQWHRSQIERSTRPRLVYVEYLSTAPWNRRAIEDPPDYVGIGRVLMGFSRRRSAELGYDGRVGLHALPTAEGFYYRLRMPNYGPDPEKDGLVYFEDSPL